MSASCATRSSHHEQAIQLGLLGVANTEDPGVNHFAQEAIIAQQWEIGYMTALLEDWGYGTGSTERGNQEWSGWTCRRPWRTCRAWRVTRRWLPSGG